MQMWVISTISIHFVGAGPRSSIKFEAALGDSDNAE